MEQVWFLVNKQMHIGQQIIVHSLLSLPRCVLIACTPLSARSESMEYANISKLKRNKSICHFLGQDNDN